MEKLQWKKLIPQKRDEGGRGRGAGAGRTGCGPLCRWIKAIQGAERSCTGTAPTIRTQLPSGVITCLPLPTLHTCNHHLQTRCKKLMCLLEYSLFHNGRILYKLSKWKLVLGPFETITLAWVLQVAVSPWKIYPYKWHSLMSGLYADFLSDLLYCKNMLVLNWYIYEVKIRFKKFTWGKSNWGIVLPLMGKGCCEVSAVFLVVSLAIESALLW
jgi:hypothetical protein